MQRLVQVRKLAADAGHAEFAERFAGIEDMPKAQLGSTVVAALTFVQEKPEFSDIATQLAMVAMNLKNLK